ncbi:MAG: hypothetical protein M1376_09955 [Planctomycetes bacterium]|nr:hypothetical protein [Planctomycetota bacterium]
MRYSIATVLIVLFPVWMPTAAFAQARLTVEVKNHTANGATVAGDEVVLEVYRGQEQIESLQAKVGADGKAVFENILTGPNMAAVATAKHQNMAFRSEPVALNPATGEFSAGVQVFDVSTDTAQLSVGVHHILVAVRGAALEFTEYMQLKNVSDRAITGAKRDDQNRPSVIEVRLPQGFQDLSASGYLEPEALVVTADGFYDTMAVPPGEHQVTFSYKVGINRRTVKIVKEITLPTAELMLFWTHGQGKLEGLGEPNDRLANADGAPMEYYRRSNLKPGDRLAFQFSGFKAKSGDYSWIVLGVVFAALVVIALWRLRRSPQRRCASGAVESGRERA